MINDPELKRRFDRVREMYLNSVAAILPDYNVEIVITDITELDDEDSTSADISNQFSPSFGLDIKLTSHRYGKEIEFSFSDGRDFDTNEYYNAFKFFINRIGTELKDANFDHHWFSLQDYLTYSNIKREIDDIFLVPKISTTYEKLKDYIDTVLLVLKQEDIKHILKSKDWINVPHDKSMYF